MPRYTRTTPPRLDPRDEPQIGPEAFDVQLQVRIADPEVVRDMIAEGTLDAIITTAATAEMLGLSEGYLRNLRSAGVGPVPVRHPGSGHAAGYRLSDVRAYIAGLETGEAA